MGSKKEESIRKRSAHLLSPRRKLSIDTTRGWPKKRGRPHTPPQCLPSCSQFCFTLAFSYVATYELRSKREEWAWKEQEGRHCRNLTKIARQSAGNLLDVLTAIREKLVPCPHRDCSGSTYQFYSSHGFEQHWRRFHHRPSNHFSQDKVFMGQSLLKKIHFELVKEVLNEKFKKWSEREKVIMCI